LTSRPAAWRIIALAAALPLVGLLLVYGSMRLGFWNTNLARVRAWYARPPSIFVKVDGVDLHVRDEGAGPVVVMLHGSIVSLHEWDPVVARLKSRYRIIRLDWPPYGVSGTDPTGVYSTAREARLLAGLVERMGLGRFSLVATSNGANIALRYAADHPEHVAAMALSILPLERPSQTRKADPLIVWLGKLHQAILPNFHTRLWYRLIVKDTAAPGFHPPSALVDMMYDMDNLPGAGARQKAYIASNTHLFRTSDVGAVAERVRAPVLLQWCARDTVISQSARASAARFTHAPVRVIYYPNVGHFPMWEDPDRFSADLGRFLEGVTAAKTGT
jgi:pimeloyl-ACP methyl ester carboxylesterase